MERIDKGLVLRNLPKVDEEVSEVSDRGWVETQDLPARDRLVTLESRVLRCLLPHK